MWFKFNQAHTLANNQKPVCNFLLANNTNLADISTHTFCKVMQNIGQLSLLTRVSLFNIWVSGEPLNS